MLPLTIALALAAAPSAFEQHFERATKLYADAEWDAALRELTIAEKLVSTDAERVKLLLCQGVILANVPEPEAADAAFTRALSFDPNAELPVRAAPRVDGAFQRAKKAALAEARSRAATAQAKPAPPPPAPPPPVVAAASLPTAAPQVLEEAPPKKRHVLALVLGLAGVAAAGSATAFGVFAQQNVSSARNAMWADDKAHFRDQAQSQALIANLGFGLAGALVLAAAIDFFFFE